jgi:cephalosporin-C deacetylase-like acetyl esterase
VRFGVTTLLVLVLSASVATPQAPDARQQLITYLNQLAAAHLAARVRSVAGIKTRAAAEQRQRDVRARIRALAGGLPEHRQPPAVKATGVVGGDGFRMEKIAYESLPGFWVTANLYLPAASTGRRPAVVLAPGHGAGGKTELWTWGANFARNGIIALAYDPIGQGERLQYFDPEKKVSIVGNPTGEHGEANIGPLLVGDTIARYMVNDAVRGIDYLLTRPDVDGTRLGAFGCSGGGTATALLAAIDDRLAVAASACYITSFDALLTSATGVQEAEQSLPRFISSGLDFPDWIEAFAPKPYAIVSTEDDMFPFAGARQTVDEARRIYDLYGARDRLQWITGPGGHGNLTPIASRILAFFTTHLATGQGGPGYVPMSPDSADVMTVTPSGQVSTSWSGETVASLARTRAATLVPAAAAVTGVNGVRRLQTRLRADIRALTGAVRVPGAAVAPMTIRTTADRNGYRLHDVTLASDGGTSITGQLAIPDGAGRKPSALLMDSGAGDSTPDSGRRLNGEVDRLARAGVVVLAIEPRPSPPGTESIKSPFLGIFNLLSLRAFLVGRTLVGLRVDDVIRAVDWLSASAEVGTITVHGVGPHGIVAVHAAVLDARISRLVLERTLVSYRAIVDEPLHRNVSEAVVPGVLRRYDTHDLLLATYPRPVRVIVPVDATGAPLTDAGADAALERVRAAERKAGLGRGDRIVHASTPDGTP